MYAILTFPCYCFFILLLCILFWPFPAIASLFCYFVYYFRLPLLLLLSFATLYACCSLLFSLILTVSDIFEPFSILSCPNIFTTMLVMSLSSSACFVDTFPLLSLLSWYLLLLYSSWYLPAPLLVVVIPAPLLAVVILTCSSPCRHGACCSPRHHDTYLLLALMFCLP